MIFYNEQLLQLITSNYLQRATSAISKERTLEQVIFYNEQLEKGVASEFCEFCNE